MKLELIEKLPSGPAKETPILFVHGAWHDALCWDEFFLPYFAEQGYSAYAVSLQGHDIRDGKEAERLEDIRLCIRCHQSLRPS